MITRLLTLSVIVSMVTCETGVSDNNDEEWSYQWYKDESFSLLCNSTKLSVQPNNYVVWETPGGNFLQHGYKNSHYEVMAKNGVDGMALMVKRVQKDVHGVYICRVYNGSDATLLNRMILGLNIHDEKYRDLFDKYRQNLIVAVIATLVFVVPLSTVCFVYQFQYRSQDERNERRLKKTGTHKFMYNAGEHPMKSRENLVEGDQPSNERDAYDNPNFTKL